MLDIDYATAATKSTLMEKARAAVTDRHWSGRPGDGWLVDNTGFPQTFGTHGQATIFANADGTAYEVKLFDDSGNEVRSLQRKTLDAAFNVGKHLVRKG